MHSICKRRYYMSPENWGACQSPQHAVDRSEHFIVAMQIILVVLLCPGASGPVGRFLPACGRGQSSEGCHLRHAETLRWWDVRECYVLVSIAVALNTIRVQKFPLWFALSHLVLGLLHTDIRERPTVCRPARPTTERKHWGRAKESRPILVREE